MIINEVDIFLQYTTKSSSYCNEYHYHLVNSSGAWSERSRDYHDAQMLKFLNLFNKAFAEEYPMFKDYSFEPRVIAGIPCCTVSFEIQPRIFPPHKDF